jgi:hypothetical protein
VRQRDALCTSDSARNPATLNAVILINLLPLLLCAILFRPEGHRAPRAKRKVHNTRTTYNVDRLVRVLRDIVRTCAVELDEYMIDWVLHGVLDVCADLGHRRGEGAKRGRLVRWVTVDRVAVVQMNALVSMELYLLGMGWVGRQDEGDSYLPSASISPSTATKRGTSPPECIVKRKEEERRWERTPVMHDIPGYLLPEILERDLCKLRRKDVLNQVRVAFPYLVTHTQYGYQYF